jgi:Anti-sigma-K factor rskA, C-terminal
MSAPDAAPAAPRDLASAPSHRRLWWQAAGAAVAMVVFGACALVVRGALRQRDEMRAVLAQVREPYDQQIAALGARVSGQSRLIASLADPDVRVADLRAPSAGGLAGAAGAAGRAFWRPATHGWTIFAHGLAAAPAGWMYHLWFVLADGANRAGGAFKQGSVETPVLTTMFDAGAQRVDALVITLDDSAMVRPGTGAVMLIGRVGAR